MQPLRSIGIYLGLVFLGAAILTPWVFKLVQIAASHFSFLSGFAEQPFRRYFVRILQVLALAGLWPFLKSVGMRSWRDLGLASGPNARRELGRGLFVGFVSLALVLVVAVNVGARSLNFDHSRMEFWKHLLNACVAAAFVAVLEETLFRGALFGSLRRIYYWLFALTLSSLLFSALHFLQRPVPPETVDWTSGFRVLGSMLSGFTQPRVLFPSFLNLTMVGFILGLAYQRTGTLHFAIGLHGGWIFWQKSYGFLTREGSTAVPWFWGSAKLIDGWLTFVVLWLTLFFVWREEEGERWGS